MRRHTARSQGVLTKTKEWRTEMMFTTAIGAMTLAALGPNHANHNYAKDQVQAPQVIEIRAEMIQENAVRRGQVRYSDQTRGRVVAQANADGSVQWANSDRSRLGGEDGPELIYVQMLDGMFAIDPFQAMPAANEATAQMLFRGTTLQTDRTQHGRQYIERTEELFRKLEQARHDWLRDNGYYNPKVFTNPNASQGEEQARVNKLPEPSAVFERPADIPRVKSREQVKGDDNNMNAIVAAMSNDDQPIRISLPHNMAQDVVARAEKMNKATETAETEKEVESTEVASNQ